MNSILMSVQRDIEQYVKRTTTVFDVRMDVTDENLVRVTGTRNFDNNIGLPLRVGRMFRQTMESRRIIFVKELQDSEHCCNCVNLPICGDGVRLYCPIILDEQVIGALSILAETKQQNEKMLEQPEVYIEYIQSIADWITLKVTEYKDELRRKYNLEMQQNLMNVVNEGVMVLNNRQQILFMNERCENILGCNLKQIQYLAKNNMFFIRREGSALKKQYNDKMRYRVKICDKIILLDGFIRSIHNQESYEMDTIYIFADTKTLHENIQQNQYATSFTFRDLTGKDPAFANMIDQCKKAIQMDKPVLLVGENGTGKDVIARTLHWESAFRNGTFITTCRDIDYTGKKILKESVLGLDQIWSNGELLSNDSLNGNTLYVDEVMNLKWENQQTLLAIINNCSAIHTKLICSTTSDLKKQMEKGNFYAELYYALEFHTIQIPPLRSRGNDIDLFIDEFLKIANIRTQRNIKISKELRQKMLGYPWTGNISELRNFVNSIVDQAAFSEEAVTSANLPKSLMQKFNNEKKNVYNLAELEKNMIVQALNDLEGRSYSKAQIARELGIGVATLYRKMKEYGIQSDIFYK